MILNFLIISSIFSVFFVHTKIFLNIEVLLKMIPYVEIIILDGF